MIQHILSPLAICVGKIEGAEFCVFLAALENSFLDGRVKMLEFALIVVQIEHE